MRPFGSEGPKTPKIPAEGPLYFGLEPVYGFVSQKYMWFGFMSIFHRKIASYGIFNGICFYFCFPIILPLCLSSLVDRSNYLLCRTESETCPHNVRPALQHQEIFLTAMPDTKMVPVDQAQSPNFFSKYLKIHKYFWLLECSVWKKWEEMFEVKRCLARLSPDLHPAAPSFVSSSRPQLHIIPTLTFACSESPLLDHKCGLSTYQRRYYETGVEKWKRSPGASRGTICLAASSLLQGVAVAQLMEGSSYPGPGQFRIKCYRTSS